MNGHDEETYERIKTELRIIKEAEAVAGRWEGVEIGEGYKEGYIAGATSERNKAIDDCRIAITEMQHGINHTLLEKLESLKLTNQPNDSTQ